MMGVWQPASNFKDYVSHNPPGVTFLLCLLALSLSFICLSAYIYTHTLPNPDITRDWNQILSSLSNFQLCEKINASTGGQPSGVHVAMTEEDMNTQSLQNVSRLYVRVPLALTASADMDSAETIALHATLVSSQLGLGGNVSIAVTLYFLCGNDSHTCLAISAPTDLVPQTLLPPECPSNENISPVHMEVWDHQPSVQRTCYSLQATFDPTLTVMLTQEEQYLAVRHLLEVSACLLSIFLMLCLRASLTGSLIQHFYERGLDLQSEQRLLNDE